MNINDSLLETLLERVDYLIAHLVEQADDKPLSMYQARKEAKCGQSVIQEAVKSGELPAHRDGTTNLGHERWVIIRRDLHRWASKRALAKTNI